MKIRILVILSLSLFIGMTPAQEKSEPIMPIPPGNSEWHMQLLARAKKGNIDVVFFGDSSTAGWTKTGMEVWKQRLDPLKAVNFGVNGNGIGHLLWRLQNGEIEGYKPKVAVIWIGHVNVFLGKQNAGDIADGIVACVKEIHKKQPDTKILLMALFHAYPQWSEKQRAMTIDVNKLLAKQADGKEGTHALLPGVTTHCRPERSGSAPCSRQVLRLP